LDKIVVKMNICFVFVMAATGVSSVLALEEEATTSYDTVYGRTICGEGVHGWKVCWDLPGRNPQQMFHEGGMHVCEVDENNRVFCWKENSTHSMTQN
jgi:hypothetical protein